MINIETLKDFSQLRKYKSGTTFSRDGTGTEMLVVFQGEVAIINSLDDTVIGIVESGDFFDASLVFSNKRIHITSNAITDVIALPISEINIASFLVSEPKFMFELMKAMHDRIERISNDYEEDIGLKWKERKTMFANKDIETKSNTQNKCDQTNDKLQLIEPSVDDTQVVVSQVDFKLFPEGHTGEYILALTNDNTNMCEIDYKCPVCGNKFKGLMILSSKLGPHTTDNDMRKHYKDLEPVYYEVRTCPHCLYSALENIFEKPEDIETSLVEALKELRNTVNFQFGTKPDTAAIFAGYYLALLCAPKCFSKAHLIQAKLLHKLSWLYQDCKDEQMEMDLAKQALDKYMKAYLESELSPAGEIQLVMTIGELNAKLGNFKEARNYYYKAKMNTKISAVLKVRTENRLEELKNLEQANEKNEVEEVKNTNVKGRRLLHHI